MKEKEGKEMKGKNLLVTLKKIEEGETYDIWNLLPDVASGEEWAGEIKDGAQAVADYIQEDEDYDIDDLRDNSHEYADGCTASSYRHIHDQVHELRLWASNDIEAEVEELGGNSEPSSLTRLEALYYYTAMRMVFDAVADQAFQNTEEEEEE
jgi:hypothetical protein